MTFRKKMAVSALTISMLAASFNGLTFGQNGLNERIGLVGIAHAADSGLPSSQFLDRLYKLHTALAAGDPVDVQDVRNLRNEIAGLDVASNLSLIDPIWNKINGKLPESVDKEALREKLFIIIKEVGAFQYDPSASALEEIRTNHEYRAVLKTVAAASGSADLKMDDFLVFLFGDGGSRVGVEGTVRNVIAGLSPLELLGLLGDKQGITGVLLQAMERQLGDTGSYRLSEILAGLDITPQDVRSTVLNFQIALQKDEPAINAMTVAYLRSEAVESVKISEDGLRHDYSLKVLGLAVPALALKWSKVSGSEAVTVLPNGTVTIPEGVEGASAVIQASLVNPYGGAAKVLFEKEVTLSASEQSKFPSEQFLERMNKLHAALAAGDPADAQAVRELRNEIANLDPIKDQALLDPIWKAISAKLPESADQAALKASLFEIIKAVGAFQYDPNAEDLEAIRTNPEYRTTLKTIAAAGGLSSLTMDDFLILLFGDGDKLRGIEGTLIDTAASLKPKDLARLLESKDKRNEFLIEVIGKVFTAKDDYEISKALYNLGIRSGHIGSTVAGFQKRLKYDEAAQNALLVAYIRSETKSTVKVTANGKQHQYGLVLGNIELPNSVLVWSKVSGSKDVKVDKNGKVSIPNKIAKGTAVIQAAIVNPYGGKPKVVFEQEVTLENGNAQENPETAAKEAIKALDDKLSDIKAKLKTAEDDEQKVSLILETVQAGNETAALISGLEWNQAKKNKAIAEAKTKVNKLLLAIIQDLMKF